LQGVGLDKVILVPKEERIRFIIDTLARFVMEDGTDLEQLILEAEHHNPEFEFLRDVDSPEHMYYRWRLYSLCNSDSMSKWRTEPFVMIETGPRIAPPPLHGASFGGVTAAQRGAFLLAKCSRRIHRKLV
jgi:U2-associated protein SR140